MRPDGLAGAEWDDEEGNWRGREGARNTAEDLLPKTALPLASQVGSQQARPQIRKAATGLPLKQSQASRARATLGTTI